MTALGAYLTPPQVFTDRPASLAELAEYARYAQWTTQDAGLVRACGIWWYRLVGYPKTVTGRYAEWIWQRPGRAIPALLTVKLIAHTTPGAWVVDHVVYPAAQLAGHIFL